jgi:prepilin-type processing-associated H-X9-DG protein/prepilin-type N-terminal cleavage/methylation domain-containing protein
VNRRTRAIAASPLPTQVAVRARAFTLVELLVSVAIIALLLAVALPMLGSTIRTARGFRCQMSLRSVAFDFQIFANDQLHGDRGDDARDLGPGRFRLATFQESQYGLDEFWRWGDGVDSHSFPDTSNNDPMRCSEVRAPVTVRRNIPCTDGAIDPPQNVSFGFNARLQWSEQVDDRGRVRVTENQLTERILDDAHADSVPLAWDVDGALAAQRESLPIFSAPSLDSVGAFAADRFWYPGRRHNGAANFAFLDGHVKPSANPLSEPGWSWAYQAVR